jgi:hypothetical protein
MDVAITPAATTATAAPIQLRLTSSGYSRWSGESALGELHGTGGHLVHQDRPGSTAGYRR